jgi:ABC-type Fe3+ transport system permease subunit
MRPTLNPLAALAAAVIVTIVLCAAFLALLATGAALAISAPPDIGSTWHAGHAGHAGAWTAGFGPCVLLLAVVGGIALAGALFRSERRVGPALRASTRRNAPRRA